MTRTLTGYIARETEAAIGFLATADIAKPLWIPRKKIASMIERDEMSASVQLAGETIQRVATPVTLEVDAAFLEKVGV